MFEEGLSDEYMCGIETVNSAALMHPSYYSMCWQFETSVLMYPTTPNLLEISL
jgi:hypothetical protein